MAKIPVGATISRAYSFAFGNFLTNLGQVWVPIAILGGIGFMLRPYLTSYMQALTNHNFSAVGHFIAIFIPLYLIELLLLTMQMVALTEEALGLRTGPAWYNFSLGKTVWRVIGAMIVVFALFFVAALVAGVGLALVFILAKLAGAAFLDVVAIIVFYGATLYGMVRLTFLLTPATVAEGRISPIRAWNLARGNFWRIIAIGLAIFIPVMAVEAIFVFGFALQGMPPTIAPGASPADQAAVMQQMSAWAASNQQRAAHYWFILYPVGGLLTVALFGLGAGAQSFAYRALVAQEAAGDAV